jgi:ElaB/YqjD/DUF883 family membrane-anchored ribosome-binding protein
MQKSARKPGKESIDTRLGALRSELESLETDMKGLVSDVEGVADSRVHLAIRKAQETAERGYHLAEEAAARAADDVESWANGNLDVARKSIRSQPFSAIALSLGIGALLGAIFLRR